MPENLHFHCRDIDSITQKCGQVHIGTGRQDMSVNSKVDGTHTASRWLVVESVQTGLELNTGSFDKVLSWTAWTTNMKSANMRRCDRWK